MSIHIVACIITIVLYGITNPAAALEVPLTYEKYPDKPQSFRPRGYTDLDIMEEPPAGDWTFPDVVSDQPIYSFIRLGDTERLVLLDVRNSDDYFYNRLYFDANGNGDITDDPVIDGKLNSIRKSMCLTEFPPIDTTFKVNGKMVPYSFRLELSGRIPIRFGIIQNCTYSGSFTAGDTDNRVMFGDSNCNGRFNEPCTIKNLSTYSSYNTYGPDGDEFYITTGKKFGFYESQILGHKLLIKDTLYEVTVNTSEGIMKLVEISEELAPLAVSMKTERLSLLIADGSECIMMYKPGNTVMIPEGNYRLLAYQDCREDNQGDLWSVRASATNESRIFSVSALQINCLELGEPYVPMINLPDLQNQFSKHPTSKLYMKYITMGSGGELLTDIHHIMGISTRIELSSSIKTRPKEPVFRIVKTDGEIVTQGSFEYG